MAFFKFRMPDASTSNDASGADASSPASTEVLRQRARHRLMGAAVLVVVAVLGFPLLFDTQPRTVPVDISVDIPDKTKNRSIPTQLSDAASAPVSQASPPAQPTDTEPPAVPAVKADQSLGPKEELLVSKSIAAPSKPSAPSAPSANLSPAPAPIAPPVSATAPPDGKLPVKDSDRPSVKVGPSADKSASLGSGDSAQRFVVQVGAYSDADKIKETRRKLEAAGLKTYTHVAETKEGKRTRVRIGPFTNRDEADKTAAKVKKMDFTPLVLSL